MSVTALAAALLEIPPEAEMDVTKFCFTAAEGRLQTGFSLLGGRKHSRHCPPSGLPGQAQPVISSQLPHQSLDLQRVQQAVIDGTTAVFLRLLHLFSPVGPVHPRAGGIFQLQ